MRVFIFDLATTRDNAHLTRSRSVGKVLDMRHHLRQLTGFLYALASLIGYTCQTLRDWWIELGNAHNYSRHLAAHKADNSSWNQLRHTPRGYRYGGIVRTGAVTMRTSN